MSNILNKVINEAKPISNLGMISPDSPLRKQIESALKTKVKLTKKQRPKIIIVEENKKTRKTKPKVEKVEKPPKVEKPKVEKPPKVVKEKPEKTRKIKEPILKIEKPEKTRKNKKEKEKELITTYPISTEQHKLEGISKIQEPIEEISSEEESMS